MRKLSNIPFPISLAILGALAVALSSGVYAQDTEVQNSLGSQDTVQESTKKLFNTIAPATVTLWAYDNDDELKLGSGFFIASTGQIVTSYHVIQGASRVSVQLFNGDILESEGVLYFDPTYDIAIIKVPGAMYPVLTSRVSLPLPGEQVFAFGNSEGTGITISQGLVSSPYDNQTKLIKFNAPVSHGNSGGPLVDNNGEVLGIVSMQLIEGQLLNFAYTSTLLVSVDTDSLLAQPFDSLAKHEDNSKFVVMVMPFNDAESFIKEGTRDYDDFMSKIAKRVEGYITGSGPDDGTPLLFVDYERGLAVLHQSGSIYSGALSDQNIRNSTSADLLVKGSIGIDTSQHSKTVVKGIWPMWKVETNWLHDDSVKIELWDKEANEYRTIYTKRNVSKFFYTNYKFQKRYYSEGRARQLAISGSVETYGIDIIDEYHRTFWRLFDRREIIRAIEKYS